MLKYNNGKVILAYIRFEFPAMFKSCQGNNFTVQALRAFPIWTYQIKAKFEKKILFYQN